MSESASVAGRVDAGPGRTGAYLDVARVVRAHGVRGELRCELLTDFPRRFKPGLRVFVGEEHTPYVVERARLQRGHLLLKLAGVESRSEAEALQGAIVRVSESDAVRLPRGSYFWHQIIGLQVRTTDGQVLGSVIDILQTGSNDVYVVRREAAGQGDLLLPAIRDVIQTIDLDRGEMTVRLLEGLG